MSGRREEDGKAFAAELKALGAEAEYIRADVSIEDDVQALVDGTVKTFGKLAPTSAACSSLLSMSCA